VSTASPVPSRRLNAVLREDDARVTPLELFFDLVFVLAITQCTALMAEEPTWIGIGKGHCWCWACCGGLGSATRG